MEGLTDLFGRIDHRHNVINKISTGVFQTLGKALP